MISKNENENDAKNHVIFQVSKFVFENRKISHDFLTNFWEIIISNEIAQNRMIVQNQFSNI